MALAAALADAGTPVNSMKTDALVTLRFVDGAPTITSINLTTVGDVPGIDEATFRQAAEGPRRGARQPGAGRRARRDARRLAGMTV